MIAIAACAGAEAEPEADPAFAYTVGSPLFYAGLPVVPAAAPAETEAAAKTPATPLVLSYAGLPYTGLHYTGLPYTGLTYTAAAPLAGCQNNEGALVPCHGGVYHHPYFVPGVVAAAPAAEAKKDDAVVVTKREAEPAAEADPEADPWYYYSTHGYYPRGYSYSYAPYAHTYGGLGYGYGGYGHGYLGHYGGYGYGGYYGRKKREAEAEPEAEADPEADPWYFYSGYGGYHLGYAHTYAAPYTYAAYHHPLIYAVGGCRNYLGSLVPCAQG